MNVLWLLLLIAAERSPKWDKVRDAYVRQNPACAWCLSTNDLEVHHVRPFHLAPELELAATNLLSLCRQHHFSLGHGGDWRKENTNLMTTLQLTNLISALEQVESGGKANAVNGDCVGILQLRPIFVEEAKRIGRLRDKGRWISYLLEDRFSPEASRHMVRVWLQDRIKYNPKWGIRELALAFKMGERGMKYPTPRDLDYAERVVRLAMKEPRKGLL